jgi:putative phosphonate metabolism protein
MSREFVRHALYFLPPKGSGLEDFGDSWLGWSVTEGRVVAHPQIADLPIATLTERPRKYGFHGTLKAPFRLADGVRESDLISTATALASSIPAFEMPALQIARLGSFLALVPQQPSAELQQLASSLVRELDPLRAPLSDAELVRRRSAGLTPAQEMLLTKWGYPYVMDEFRFHLTLSGKLQADELQNLKSILQNHISPLTQTPVRVDDVGLVGEAEDGRFHLIRRLPLAAAKR